MGLYRRDNKVWWISYSYKGKQYRISTGTTDKKLAEKVLAKVITQIVEKKWFERPIGSEITLKELLEKYLEEHSEVNKAPTSFVRDKSLANHLKRFFGEIYLTDIAPRAVSAYKVKRRKEGAAPNTVNNELRLLSHAFNLAIKEWEWVEVNPVSRVSKERVNNQIERWLTFDEEERLLKASPYWLKEILVFALNTGLRRGEIINLRWPRVDLARKIFMILEQKNRGRDTLPLNQKALEVLKARAKVRSIKTDYVFYNQEGNAHDSSNLRRAFLVALKEAKIVDFRFHDLRHTFATRLVQAGVDLYKVQRLIRHKSPQMTQRYAHHYPESLRDGVEILDALDEKIITFLSHSG
jgi:integrase